MNCSQCDVRSGGGWICSSCAGEIQSLIALASRLSSEHQILGQTPPVSDSSKSVMKWMIYLKESVESLNKKTSFLKGFLSAFTGAIHPDIFHRAGDDDRPPFPAHRALLASRSEIFKTMLNCKYTPGNTITIPDLTSEELKTLLEFLYSGDLSQEQLRRHVNSPFIAADEYEIPYLSEFCESYMVSNLNLSNVLNVLSVADMCSKKSLKDKALEFIVENAGDRMFWTKYEAFVLGNSRLCVEITKAFSDSKKKGSSTKKKGSSRSN